MSVAAPTQTEPAAPAAAHARAAARPPAPGRRPASRGAPLSSLRGQLWWTALLVAAIFCWITFYATGGLNSESMAFTEIALSLGGGVAIAAAVLLAPARARLYGAWPVGLLLAFAALSALSIVWSVQPDYSWLDASRLFAYSAVFAAGVALVRVAPARWSAVLGGLALSAVVIAGYALATKVFPATLAPSNAFARLNEPYGYWNAVGLSAAMGVICCTWLGARRSGHALLRALAYPATGLLLLTLVLAYSRGALAALAIGLALWFCMVPLRLRSAAVLLAGALGAGAVLAWDFSKHALSAESVPLAERDLAGHQLGALALAMLLVLGAVGVCVGFLTARRAPSALSRRRAGAALFGALVLVVLALVVALAHSQRGFTGTISHDFSALVNPNAKPPPNTPGRLTAVASVRARYWKEALQVFAAHPLLGAGAEGYRTAHLRYETSTLEVRHAHGFLVQTLADLGLAGLVLSLALLLTWLAAAGRATHPFNRSWTRWRAWRELRSGARPGWRPLEDPALTRYSAERIGMLAMLCVVVVFGAHSLVDWTWYVPGCACVALLCAGWLAGRGPLAPLAAAASARAESADAAVTVVTRPPRARRPAGIAAQPSSAGAGAGGTASALARTLLVRDRARTLIAAAVLVAALLAAWAQWQPQRAEEARQEALALAAAGNRRGATAAAERAVSRDPLSQDALFTLARIQQATGSTARARATLERAVRLQPSNPLTWLSLARFELTRRPAAAVKELQAAIYLDPESISNEAIAAKRPEAIEIHNLYVQALQAAERARAPALRSASGPPARAAPGARPAGRPRREPRSARTRSPRAAR